MFRTFLVSAPDIWGGLAHYAVGATDINVSPSGWLTLSLDDEVSAAFAPGWWVSFKDLSV